MIMWLWSGVERVEGNAEDGEEKKIKTPESLADVL